jgi:hypothetical protein
VKPALHKTFAKNNWSLSASFPESLKNLALSKEWGNKAEKMLSITLPAGTIVYVGIVAPQTPKFCYPGGGQQTFIEDLKDPHLFWTEGPVLTLEDPTCP